VKDMAKLLENEKCARRTLMKFDKNQKFQKIAYVVKDCVVDLQATAVSRQRQPIQC